MLSLGFLIPFGLLMYFSFHAHEQRLTAGAPRAPCRRCSALCRTADGHPGIFTKKGPEDTGPAAEDADYADLVMIYLFADAATYSAVPLPSLASPNAVSQRPLKRTCKDHLCVNFRHLQCCAVDPVIAG